MSGPRVDISFQIHFKQNMGTEAFLLCRGQLGIEITQWDFSLVLYFDQQFPLAGLLHILLCFFSMPQTHHRCVNEQYELKSKETTEPLKGLKECSHVIIFLCHSE